MIQQRKAPRAVTRGAMLAEGADKTVAPAWIAYHGAGTQAKRSPKDRSASPGRVAKLPKVAINDPGLSRHQIGQGDGTAPASKIAEAWGQPEPLAGACHPMPSAQALSNQQYQIRHC